MLIGGWGVKPMQCKDLGSSYYCNRSLSSNGPLGNTSLKKRMFSFGHCPNYLFFSGGVPFKGLIVQMTLVQMRVVG